MQQKGASKLLTASQYARLRGLNRSTIGRQVQSGAIPTCNGLIDPKEADRARLRNINQSKRLGAENRKRNPQPDSDTEPGVKEEIGVETNYRVCALADIAAKSEVLKFARIALHHLGCPPVVACALGQLHALQAGAALPDVECDELDSRFVDPDPAEWRAVLGGALDMEEANRLCDSVAALI